ncbi:MAG: hypothetical protein WC071_07840 [Victivallaceae bacterium]
MNIINKNQPTNQRLQKPWIIGILCFFILALLNAPYLYNPPYWDEIIGLHNQALWLKNHQFNFIMLWHHGGNEGPNVYPFSLYPLLYGILYVLFTSQTVHHIGHFLGLLAISCSFALSYSLIMRFSSNWLTAVLFSAAALCEPVMAGRITESGFDGVLCFLVVLTVYYISRQHYWAVLGVITLSFFIKPTGFLLFCAVATFLIILPCLKENDFAFKKRRSFICAFIAMLLLAAGLYKVFSDSSGGVFLTWGGYFNNFYQFYRLIPMSGILLLTVIVAGIFAAVKVAIPCIKQRKMPVFNSELATLLFILIFICGFWVAYMIFTISLPRYTAITVFPMFVFLGIAIKRRTVAIPLAVILAVAGYLCWDNRFLPALPAGLSRSGDLLERNRGYLKDLDGNRRLCKFLEENYFNHTIVAKGPFLQMLTIPEFGYVEKPLPNVLSAVTNTPLYCPVKNLNPTTVPPDAFYIYSRNVCEYGVDDYCLAPFRGDTLIYIDGKPPAVNVIYMKSPARRLLTLKEFRQQLEQAGN